MAKDFILYVRITQVERVALDQLAEIDTRTRSGLARHELRQVIDKADAEGKISLDEICRELKSETLPCAHQAGREA
jgi:hypothetical protein